MVKVNQAPQLQLTSLEWIPPALVGRRRGEGIRKQ